MTASIRIRYQTVEFGTTDIHICTLRDNQEFSDPDGVASELGITSAQWPLFGVIWPSSLVLAHFMDGYKTEGKRILEVGCGMALSSLLLNKQRADITATDFHPEAEFFLKRNTQLNNDNDICFERVDWADDSDTLDRFDLIIGSDLLYEDPHINLLADFLASHANPACDIIIVDPGRGRKSKFITAMARHGFSSDHFKPVHTNYLPAPYKGYILTFSRTA